MKADVSKILLRCGLVVCVLWFGITSAVVADEFPTFVRSKSAGQIKSLVEDAAIAGMIPFDIQIKVTRGGPRFDCQFQPNSSKTPWLIIMNASPQVMTKRDQEYSQQGYFRAIERFAQFQGQTFYTIVWHKKPEQKRPLVLPKDPVPVAGVEDPRLNPLDVFMKAFLLQHNVAGATVAVAKDGRLMYSKGFGYSDVEKREPMLADSAMRIASISKPITAIAVLKLAEKRKLALDEPIMPLLETRRYRIPSAGDERWNDIAIRQLLQHTGGWDRDVSPDPMFQVVEITRKKKLRRPARQADILKYQLSQRLDFDPGERYAYSNFGYSVMGRVMEAVGENSYEKLVEELVLKPCGMKNTRLGKTRLEDRLDGEVRYHMQTAEYHSPFWSVPEKARVGTKPIVHPPVEDPYGRWDLEVMDAHGGWVSTAPDLLRLVSAMDAKKDSLLSEASLEAMVAKPKFDSPNDDAVWYGAGWQVRSKKTESDSVLGSHNIWHNGALAGTSTLLVKRYDGMSWAVLFNTDRSTNGDRLASLIDSQMHYAVGLIKEWPDHDLFQAAP